MGGTQMKHCAINHIKIRIYCVIKLIFHNYEKWTCGY